MTNLASRGAQMLTKQLDGVVGPVDDEGQALLNKAIQQSKTIAQHYENFNYSKAIKAIREIAEDANKYFDDKQPWKTIKQDSEKTKVVLSTILNIFRVMTIYLKPVLPQYALKVEQLLNEETALTWSSLEHSLEGRKINAYKHLATRLDIKQTEKMVAEEKHNFAETPSKKVTKKMSNETKETKEITFDQFMDVELKTALIKECTEIKDADKLLNIKADLGNGDVRNIIAGIKNSYKPEELIGKTVIVAANLKPRKMKFGMSEGMILAVKDEQGQLSVLTTDKASKAGIRAK